MPMCEEMRDGCLRGCTAGSVGVVSAALAEISIGMRGSEDSRDRKNMCEGESSPSVVGSSGSSLRAGTCGSMYMSMLKAGISNGCRFG